MTIHQDLFIGGHWRPGSAKQRRPILNPADGAAVAQFAVADEADCEAATDAAAHAMPGWSAMAPRDRAELLRRSFELLTDEREMLADLIVMENGKAWADALGEADYAAEFFRWFSEEAVRVHGDYRLSPSGDKRIMVTREPIGVALLITPWNFPAAMATRKIAPALAAGCTVVLKPASETPLAAAYIMEVLQRAGVPDGVVNLVTPPSSGPGVRRMLAHPAVQKLSFTGSTEVGRLLLREASDRVISSSMELGGNAPFIVLPGADIAATVEGALLAKLRNGGAACTAANRFYVHASLRAEFTARLVERMEALTVGPGRNNDIGALVSVRERDKVHSLVRTAVDEGARLLLGGTPAGEGAFYPPTVLTDVRHGSAITATEIFGPVVTIIEYHDEAEAVRMANDSIYGLISYVFGPQGNALEVAHQLQAGMVAINRGVLSDPAAPFGGVRESGLGREGAANGILEFLEEKYIGI